MMEGGSNRTDHGNRMDRTYQHEDRTYHEDPRTYHEDPRTYHEDPHTYYEDRTDRDRSTVPVHILLHQQQGVSMLLASCYLRSLPD